MSINNNFINMMDESYQKYIKPVVNTEGKFYRVFDNNCENDRVVINGKIDKIVNLPKNLNAILNLDIETAPKLKGLFIKSGLSSDQLRNFGANMNLSSQLLDSFEEYLKHVD